MSSVQMLSKRDVFRLDLKEKRLGASRRGLGRESRSQVVCMRIKARFLYLLSLMRGTVMSPVSAERRER